LRNETRALAARLQGAQRVEATELASRAQRLYAEANGEVGPLTALQREQEAFYRQMLAELSR
jgi:hypothetical protein